MLAIRSRSGTNFFFETGHLKKGGVYFVSRARLPTQVVEREKNWDGKQQVQATTTTTTTTNNNIEFCGKPEGGGARVR